MKLFPFLKGFRQRQGAAGGFILNEDDIPVDTIGHAGVYVIETTDGTRFNYPKGKSKVIYIGMSDDLRVRLRDHRRELNELWKNIDYGIYNESEPWPSNRYQYMRYHGAKVFYYKCRGEQDAKNLESRVMWAFYTKYRALPVGNAAKSYAKQP